MSVYADILRRQKLQAEYFLMVGNSLRSDILPVLELGGWAVHVPYHITWSHEHMEMDCSGRERCFEIEGLGQVVEVLRDIEEERSQ